MEKNKKFVVILGARQDGAGLTRAIIEKQIWAKKNGISLETYYFDTGVKAEKRQALQAMPLNHENYLSVLEHINKDIDVVFFHAFPRKDFIKKDFDMFYDFVHRMNTIKIAIEHTTTEFDLNNTTQMVLMFNEMDFIYIYRAPALTQLITKLLPSKKDRIKDTHIWFNFDALETQWKVPFEEKQRRIVYAGRNASFKNTPKVLDLGAAMHKYDPTIKTEMHGVYSDIGSKFTIFDNPYCIRKGKTDVSGPQGCVEVYGPFVRDEMMDYLSHSLFGVSFFDYKDSQRMEYSQLEIVACGCIPIFDKHWAETYKLSNGEYFFEEVPAIYIDRNNITEDDVKRIHAIAQDKKYFYSLILQIRNAVQLEYDADIVLANLFRDAIRVTKDEKKFKTVEELVLYNLGEQGLELYKQNLDKIVMLNFSQLKNKRFSVLENKKIKVLKQIK